LTNKYYDGVVPTPNEFTEVDEQTLAELKAYPSVISSSIERYRFREAQVELMNVARLGNKYLADEEPWKMVKTDPERVKTQMYVALQIASALAILSEPFLPFTSKKLCAALNIELNDWNLDFDQWNSAKAGHTINQCEILFAQIEDAEIQNQIDKLEATKKSNTVEATPTIETTPTIEATPTNEEKAMEETTITPQKPTATFDDFTKLDLRVGTIIEAEKMPKADKLLVLKIDTGLDIRTVVSGIAEHFSPEEVIGKRVTILANLAPRALRGVESQGMILMTNNSEGKLVFVNPDADGVANGATIS
jgi:methionyl-tRNA synthetase